MPLPRQIREQMELERAEEHRLAQRDSFRAGVRAGLLCLAWCGIGLAITAWGLHTTDHDLGQIAWRAGQVVGYAGILFTVARWYAKARERGDTQQ
jgi:hypothetical protein